MAWSKYLMYDFLKLFGALYELLFPIFKIKEVYIEKKNKKIQRIGFQSPSCNI